MVEARLAQGLEVFGDCDRPGVVGGLRQALALVREVDRAGLADPPQEQQRMCAVRLDP